MLHRGASMLCLCIAAMHFLQVSAGIPVDPELRAHLEAKVISEMSLRDLEAMVENDDRVVNAPQSRIIIIPRPRDGKDPDPDSDAIIIERKPKKPYKQVEESPKYRAKLAYKQEEAPEYKAKLAYKQEEAPEYKTKLAYKQEEAPEYKKKLAYKQEKAPEYKTKLAYKQEEAPEYKTKLTYKKVEGAPEYRSQVAYKEVEEAPEFKSKVAYKEVEEGPTNRFGEFDSGIRRSSYEPSFEFESAFRHDEGFPSLFKISDLESAGSSPVRQFYESVVESVLSNQKFGLASDPFEALHIAASEDVPQYKPRFDYDSYSKDSTETKLEGKPYWRDAPERRDEVIDENGCRTVIKRVIDPEDEKKSSSAKAKSVVITKECESPNLNGPEAKIMEARPLRFDNSRFDSAPSSFANYEGQPSSYQNTRPEELDLKKPEERDPLASDYIDSMLEKHFKSFPGFTNPLSSFSGYQERFKLRAPEAFKNVKPTVGVQTYEYSHPKSGFEDERHEESANEKDSTNDDSPRVYEHHYNYDYPENSPRKEAGEYDDESKEDEKATDSKDPKMMKKSFAYYRKDNPKSDPDDHQYAEEYGTGNYRSFSSSYDSEKDGPKKKQ